MLDRPWIATAFATCMTATIAVPAAAQPVPPDPPPGPPPASQPGYQQPGYQQPAPAQPGYGQPGYRQPPPSHPPSGYGQPPPPPPPQEAQAYPRSPGEIFVGLGLGDAVCDKDEPDSDCPVDGALTLDFGGGWRFHDHFSLGGEIGIWAFQVRDEWRGQLESEADEVTFSSVYLAPHFRWYWFDEGATDPYLQAGVGIGSVTAEASNESGTYEYTATGFVFPVGIGVDWYLSEGFRLGPQALAYLHVSDEICSEEPNRGKVCEPPSEDEDGEREGLALPWRIMAVATFPLGDP